MKIGLLEFPKQYEPNVSIFVKETERSEKLSQSIFPIASSSFTPYVRNDTPGLLSESKNSDDDNEGAEEEPDDKSSTSSEESSPASSLESLAEKEIQDEENLEDN
jgi:hypothetical protein